MKFGEKYKNYISLDSGATFIPLTLVKPIVISGKKSPQSFNYPRKSSAWKFTRYENVQAYDLLKAAIAAYSTFAYEVILKCDLYDDWATLTGTEYTGYVPLSGISINEDNGMFELTPTENNDYDWYEQHKGDKHDIYNEVAGYTQALTYSVTTVLEQYLLPAGVGYSAPSGFTTGVGSVAQWNGNGVSYVGGYFTNSWCRYGVHLWHCQYSHTSKPTEPPGTNDDWEILYDNNTPPRPVNNVLSVHRQICDLPFYVNGHDYIHGNGVFEAGFPAVTTPDTTAGNIDATRWYYPTATTATETGTMILCGAIGMADNQLSDGENIKLLTALEHLLDGSGLTIVSDFLTNATNPVTGATNHLTNLRLVHNRVVKNIHDYDTTGEMTLDGLLKDICETFQCSWSIVGTNLYIEHINFFENGYTYTGTPTVYTDLTNTTDYPLKEQVVFDRDGSESDNEYVFSLDDCPETELFHFVDGYDYDGQIKYDSKFVKKGEILKHDPTLFMTDFAYLLCSRVESLDDSFCLIAADVNGVIHRRDTQLRWLNGGGFTRRENANSSLNYPNGDLMWNNLLNDFWDYQTIFSVGSINGQTSVTFESSRRIKKQREIKFPRVDGRFNPEYLITTNLGDGRVESFEIDTDTDYIKVTLLY